MLSLQQTMAAKYNMKITELTQPSKEQILESFSNDQGHSFSGETLNEIATAISKPSTQPAMSMEDAFKLLESGGY